MIRLDMDACEKKRKEQLRFIEAVETICDILDEVIYSGLGSPQASWSAIHSFLFPENGPGPGLNIDDTVSAQLENISIPLYTPSHTILFR